jgi:hypothetical protein
VDAAKLPVNSFAAVPAGAVKRGGRAVKVDIEAAAVVAPEPDSSILAL